MEKADRNGTAWCERYKSAYAEQTNWRRRWADCRRYVMPHDTDGETLTGSEFEGEKKAFPVTAAAADLCEKMASGLHSSTISYGERWFTLIPMSGGSEAWRRWCSSAREMSIKEMQEGNFLAATSDFVKYLCAYGTGVLFIGERDGKPMYRNIPITNNVCVESDEYGEATTVYIQYFLTAAQAASMFGEENLSRDVRTSFEEYKRTGAHGRKHEFLHITYPKALFGEKVKRAPSGEYPWEVKYLREDYRPIGGLWVDVDAQSIVKREGFFEFPFAVCPFMTANGESYGRSIPMLAMDTIKSLNRATALLLDASEMAIRPPLGVPAGLAKLDLRPGRITRVNSAAAAQIWTYQTNANIPVGDHMVERLTEELKSMFKEDFFMSISKRGEMTAAEVSERVRQATEFVSPIVMTLQHAAFKPIVRRTLAILERAGRIPRRPNEGDFRVSFTSRVDSMIRQSEASRNLNFLQQAATAGQATAANPDLRHVVNMDALYDEFAESMGISASILYDAEERAARRQAEAEAQAQAQAQAMQAEMFGKTDLTKKPEPNSVLAMMGGGRAQ